MAIVPYQNRLKKPAAELHKNMTPWERNLWYEFLREQKPRFLRQKPIGSYIVDFYCPTLKLAIELDDGQHYEPAGIESDARRTARLEEQGLTVLRFSNLDINQNFQGVCQMIQRTVCDMEVHDEKHKICP